MKKKIIVLLMVLILSVSAVLLTACNKKGDLAKFINYYSKDGISYQVEINMTMPLFGEIIHTTEIDGNITHELPFLFTSETYKEKITSGYYSYTKNYNDEWTIDFVPEVDSSEISPDNPATFSPDDFKYKKGKFELKEDKCESYGVKSMSIEVTDKGKSAIITMTQIVEGLSMSAKATFSKYNEIHLTLPVDRHAIM